MKISLRKPTKERLNQWRDKQKNVPFSYEKVGATRDKEFPAGFDHDRNECLLGNGDEVWAKAKKAIDNWVMFPGPWTEIFYPLDKARKGEEAVILFYLFGICWFNCCRVVYTFDEPNRYGFAYGTTLNHLEKGEEIFFVERRANGEVYYRIEAFSQPRFWGARLLKPIARRFQRKFVRESKAAMQKYVGMAG